MFEEVSKILVRVERAEEDDADKVVERGVVGMTKLHQKAVHRRDT